MDAPSREKQSVGEVLAACVHNGGRQVASVPAGMQEMVIQYSGGAISRGKMISGLPCRSRNRIEDCDANGCEALRTTPRGFEATGPYSKPTLFNG